MIKFITLLILAGVGSVCTFTGRFWVYDRELECNFKDEIKFILCFADICKDIVIYLILLNHLLK